MKKLFSFVFVLGAFVLVSDVSAYSESRDGGKVRDPLAPLVQKKTKEKYSNAMWQRYQNYINPKRRRASFEDQNQLKRHHNQSRADRNVTSRSTRMNRSGRLRNVPFYGLYRRSSRPAYERVNHKQTFRARAIDYYVDGGTGGTDAMKSGVILGSQHKINRFPLRRSNRAAGRAISATRDLQRSLMPWKRPTAPDKQKQPSSRKYQRFNPFQKWE